MTAKDKGEGKSLRLVTSSFTVSEVATDWHKPIAPQRIMWPFIAIGPTDSRHTIAPISHTRRSPRNRSCYSFTVPLRVGG